MTETELPMRTATPQDWDLIAQLLTVNYHNPSGELFRERFRPIFEADRSLVITDDDLIIGHISARTRDLSVPGAVVPAAHITLAAVAATHRRRGLMTRLFCQELRDTRAAGEPLAIFWPSEGRIYPRYGCGLATQRLSLEIETGELSLPQQRVPGRLRTGAPHSLLTTLAKVYDEVRGGRPGFSSRSAVDWAHVLDDSPSIRGGAGERICVFHEVDGVVDGYALWRTSFNWTPTGPACEVRVDEVVARDSDAYLALWRFLLSIDLTRTVHYEFAAIDEPLLHLASEPNRLGARVVDALWARIVHVDAALAARRYRTPVDLVFDVTDSVIPENAGRWRLTGGPTAARCVATDEAADLGCDIRDLSSAYLGGPSLGALATAGRVRELRPGALFEASTAFGWHLAPVGPEIY
ncbi:GNAT family N-acetyltransferase [Micromonospora sp. KC723]|uniref:GNAT family N-acetyltransferase n=1 Tax=Micromonospora sp. KC723 TaxID=2530381 RepID=UPI0010488123|nr:GNAT family N-acetyltransferase [Micromonospora sp. KC723]TDB76415.1 GNAT family N-acetyltransferase [Micromonospora sp. KC723]